MERDQRWSDRDWCAWLESVSACLVVFLPTGFTVALYHLWFCWFGLMKHEILQSLNPKDRMRESHPRVNLHREKLLQLPLCETEFFSCTSDLLARTYDFRICTTVHLMLILSRLNLRQKQDLEPILFCIAVLCFPHNTIACIHMCDECKRSNAPNVCPFSDRTSKFCSQKTKYRVYQYEPRKDISEQFVSKLLTTLQLIQFFLLQM